jgi:hypothetical protein
MNGPERVFGNTLILLALPPGDSLLAAFLIFDSLGYVR